MMFFRKQKCPVEYPSSIQIETTSRCNARCVFCHHPRMKRPRTEMSDEVFAKIVQDVKELKVKEINPFVNGEMFLDRKIFDRLALINKELPGVKISIFTNGALLDDEKLHRLALVKDIDVVNFSLNAVEAADYKERVGLNFDKTVSNIRNLMELNRKSQFVRHVVVASVERDKGEKCGGRQYNDAFTRFCQKHFPGAEAKIGYKYNYASRIFSFRGFRDIYCPRLKSMIVLANGLVALCCMDMEGEFILGNANERSLLDIYNGPLAREYRRHRKSHMLPCRICNMI